MAEYRLGLYEKSMPDTLTIREKLEHTRQAGFDYMELSIDESDAKLARLDWTAEQLYNLRADMWQTGTPIHSICLSGHRKYPLGHPDFKVRQRSMEIMEKAIVLASQLGIRLIQLAGYDVYYEEGCDETRDYFLENLKKAVLMAGKYGVMLGFETMETPFMNTVAKAMAYVNAVGSPWLQIYPDLGNLTNAVGEEVPTDLEAGKGHLAALHLKETVPGVFREVPFGTGHVDFVSGAGKALELGVRAFVGEFWYVGAKNWEEELAVANSFLREKLHEGAQHSRTDS
ncbi:L-ribulose-5-phosphate 3-epimerase [Feifania hominis]|uniref:L-ribulose-5-phosphate 3-epimerase n=1 Tax=Feifania hominis TaxID=2763660 RepID=UPI00201639F0